MKSTASHCLFTCMKTLFTGFMASNNVPDAGRQGWLNHCLQCDEKLKWHGICYVFRCGPKEAWYCQRNRAEPRRAVCHSRCRLGVVL
jgi:hypothetical protein